MKEYFVFSEKYVKGRDKMFDPSFIRDYETSNKFPIERDKDTIIINCPSNKRLKWYVRVSDTHLYGRIESETLLDEGLFEI